MNFTPISEEEIEKQRSGLSAGNCDFEVISATDEVSKSSGQPMLKLSLRVWDVNGQEGQIFDYLTPQAQWKILNFLKSIGREDDYLRGNIDPASLEGRSGSGIIFIQKSKDHKYGDQPKIKDYFKKETNSAVKAATEDDSIPF